MRWLPLVLLLLCAADSLRAHASAQPTDTSADAEARERFAEGRSHYDAGRFPEAAASFRRAYLLSSRYALLFNIGQSELRAGHDALALEAFEGFLRQAPEDDPHHAEVTERVRVLRSMGVTAATSDTPATPTDTTTSQTAPTLPPPSDTHGTTSPGVAPWILVGGGAAALITGAVLMGVGASRASSVTGAADGARWADLEGAEGDANTFWGLGIALVGVGLAVTAGGLVWLVTGSSDDREHTTTSLRLTPMGLRLDGAF